MINFVDEGKYKSLKIRVYIEDTDAGGIVYYVNYLKYLERARTEFIRDVGYGKAAMLDDKFLFVVHSLKVNYRSPAFLDDLIVVYSKIEKASKAAILFKQIVYREEKLLMEADVKIVSVDPNHKKISFLPKKLIDRLNHF